MARLSSREVPALVRKLVISRSPPSINSSDLLPNFRQQTPHSFFCNSTQLQVNHLRELLCSRVVLPFLNLPKHSSKSQSSLSTMRASILVALGVLSFKVGAWNTETDTVSTTTTVTILTCHPTVTNCPVSASPLVFGVSCALSTFQDTSRELEISRQSVATSIYLCKC